jgi:PmbA protein
MSVPASRTSLDQSDIEDLIQLVLDEAAKQGADQAEVGASHDFGLSATARLGDVENLEYTNDRGIGVTVYHDSRKGSASSSDFSVDALRETVAKASAFAKYTAVDRFAGLADAELMASDIPNLELSHAWRIDADAAIKIALECEDSARNYDKRISNSEGATVSTSSGVRAYGNSHGFIGSFPRTSHSISCSVVGESDGEMERDFHYSAARQPSKLETPEHIGETAARRTVGRLGSRKIKTTKAASFLLGAAGEKLFPDFFQIQERPHILGAMASRSYDADGVATSDRDLVVDGVLQGYVLSSYSARRLGLKTTANAGGAHNLIVPGNAGDMESIIKSMKSGLLVQELIGQGVNPVTGDYSRGAVGYWIENGEIAYPVHEVTIAGNLRKLYPRIIAIGNDQDIRGGIRCGSLLVDEMTIAGA